MQTAVFYNHNVQYVKHKPGKLLKGCPAVHSAKANKVSNDFPYALQALELFLKYTSDLTGYPVLLSQTGRLSKMAHHLSTVPLCYSTVLKKKAVPMMIIHHHPHRVGKYSNSFMRTNEKSE